MAETVDTAKTKTWDGLRGLWAVFATIFFGILAWLIFHEAMLESEAKLLLAIPFIFSLGGFLLAFFASDKLLTKFFSWILVFHH